MNKRLAFCCVALILIGACSIALGQYYDDTYDVPYVPTKFPVVEKMLEMVKVTGNDILIDLGCGDGRIVNTAAKKFGTHGTGIDINPVRIKESKENARKEGTEKLVKFIEGDLFEADIHNATVVTLYLLPAVNLRLRPKLFSDLKPGTRIVSHDFDMGEWDPDNYEEFEVDSDVDEDSFFTHTIYFWVIPANVSGTWSVTVSGGGSPKTYELRLEQKFQKIYGSLVDGSAVIPIIDAGVDGTSMHFAIGGNGNGSNSDMVFTGTASGDAITGTLTSKSGKRSWKASRDPATAVPLEE